MTDAQPLVIREAGPDDWARIWPLFRSVIATGDTYIVPPEITDTEGQAYWTGKGLAVYVLELDGKVVGTCSSCIAPCSYDQRSMAKHRIYAMSVASVYPHYLAKAEKKGRTKAEVDAVIRWLTGYSQVELNGRLKDKTDFETFFAEAPELNPARSAITGVVCGIRLADIEDPLMREVRYLDKLIDELAKGRAMDKILRKPATEPARTRARA